MTEIARLTASEISRAVRARELTAEAVAEAFLGRVRELDPGLKAFLQVLEEPALSAARELDRRASAGETLGRLAGVPIAVKDNMLVRGAAATCGSRILDGYRAPYDAAVIERLRAEDAVILGKTNLDEFAMGSSTEHSAFFPTRNPWASDRVPGGSSGGSAAAVAARMAPLALGSDTGGSIRQPAAFCGIVGVKPSYGLVSRYGLVAHASSLDQIGPLARTVEDAALCLSVIAGHDPRDSTCDPGPRPDYAGALEGDVRGLKIGVPKEYFAEGLEPVVESAVRGAVEAFRGLGAEAVEVSLPHTRQALSAYYILSTSEASSNLARFDGIRYGRRSGASEDLTGLYETTRGEGFGSEVKRRIMLGTYALSSGYFDAYYLKAQKVRTLVKRDFEAALSEADVLLTPVAPTPAFRVGEKSDPLQMYLSDVFTLPCNLSGCAGVSVPCGTTESGLPVGLQLMGLPSKEEVLLRAARRFEEARPFAECPA